MVFEVSTARREVLEKLCERDWTPTELGEELGKSTAAVYNHLDDLYDGGLLEKRDVTAKTRPKSEYSIGAGFVQYVAVLPGLLAENGVTLTPSKEAMFRIWSLPQEEFHPFVEEYWWRLRTSAGVDPANDLVAVGIYGSVARGHAEQGSDLDVLVVVEDDGVADRIDDVTSALKLDVGGRTTIAMTEVYTREEFRNSVAHGSDFLETSLDEVHPVYDPDGVLHRPDVTLE